MKLSDIVDDKFEFTKLHEIDESWELYRKPKYVKMEYINKKDKIFCIQCRSSPFSPWKSNKTPMKREKKCGIYDVHENEWKHVAPFKYTWMDVKFVCITVYDERLNFVYIQTNNGYTAKYDCDKDEWSILVFEKLECAITHQEWKMGKLWLNEEILTWYFTNGKIKYLHLSDDETKRKWLDDDSIKTRVDENGREYKFQLF